MSERVKGQRSSKTWWVTGPDGVEVKVTGVTSEEEAMAKVEGSTSARPMRKYKLLTEAPAEEAPVTDGE